MERKYSPTLTDRALSRYVNLLQIPDEELNNAVIVDIGSGTNQRFAKEVKDQKRSSKVISLDPSLGLGEKEDIVNFDSKYSAKARRRNSETRTLAADANNIPLNTRSVDRIYALYSLPWLTQEGKVKAVFKEMDRVLKNGGVIRAYPILEDQKLEVESALGFFPKLEAHISKRNEDDAYLLVATKHQ